MTVPDTGKNLSRLHGRARDFPSAITGSNELPEGFPRDEMRLVAQALCETDGMATPEDRQVLLHARAKLRETRWVFRGLEDELSFFQLERTHNALFAEIDALLERVPAKELVPLEPSDEPALVGRRADFEARVAALERRVDLLQTASQESLTAIDQSRHVDIALLRVGDVRLNLEGLVKVAGSLKAELAGHLIDLGWLSQLTGRIAAITESLGKGIDALRGATDELAELVRGIERARRLGERVVQGGKTLFRSIKRMMSRLGSGSPRPPRTVFRDVEAPWCPELVVIPAGRFRMGSPEDEEGRYDDEGPQHEVVIETAFALGRHPVTFDEYDTFCAATGREQADDEGWGRGRRAVINVSWEDAQAYVAWLRERTEKPYRLPSEAEWEHACRAGTTTRYGWGDGITPVLANYRGKVGRTTEVGSYPANPWRLHDMHGNVWEWVEDRWHDSYEGAPTDGSAWIEGTSPARVVRGGSWSGDAWNLRSACRDGVEPVSRSDTLGFRVARMITP